MAREAIAVWYLAEILLAETPHVDRDEYQCEACEVLLLASNAAEAYNKAVAWGEAYAAEPPAAMRLLGVSHLTTVGEELGDGTEVCGRFFEESAVWDRVAELVPPSDQLAALKWEKASDLPLVAMLGSEAVVRLNRAWGQAAPRGSHFPERP